MNEYKFNLTGQERKSFVGAISEILNAPVNYLKAPSFAYEVGTFRIDKTGTVTGEYDHTLFERLAELGYEPETETPEEPTTQQAEMDDVCIEMPLDGFTPEAIDNLTKLVESKAVLIKKALGVTELPITVLEDRIAFDWFKADTDNGSINAYAQFITCLCATAKEKKRVTARPQEAFENEKFTLRVWLLGLGLIGKEYALIRKLMLE